MLKAIGNFPWKKFHLEFPPRRIHPYFFSERKSVAFSVFLMNCADPSVNLWILAIHNRLFSGSPGSVRIKNFSKATGTLVENATSRCQFSQVRRGPDHSKRGPVNAVNINQQQEQPTLSPSFKDYCDLPAARFHTLTQPSSHQADHPF